MLLRAPSAHTRAPPAYGALPAAAQHHVHRSASPRTRGGKPDFREGSVIEEKDRTGRTLSRLRVGRLLGRGGFAKCYAMTELETGANVACKVIDRASLQKSKTLEKLHSEIAIHKRMKHKNIVNFIRTFQDDYFVYILLEKCTNQTLMEVAKNRRRFTVAETQFIGVQTLSALQYMHENNVIHRDLKLGNMMLDDDMNIKVGDFGLAAELAYDGERKRTICGTPNYIAPEILEGSREGHSFEADIWSLGVILYTLLVGEPPFQTNDVKTTYNRIKQCRYTFPPNVDVPEAGKGLIHRILQSRPDRRPTLMDIRQDPFFKSPVPPVTAPLSLFPEHLRAARDRQRASGLDVLCSAAPSTGGGLALRDVNVDPQVLKRNAGKPDSPKRHPSPREPPKLFSARSANPSSGAPPPQQQPQPLSSRAGAPAPPPQPSVAPPLPVPKLPTAFVPSAPSRAAPTVGGWCAPKEEKMGSARDEALQPPQGRPAPKVEDDDERNHLTAVHDRLHETLLMGPGQAVSSEPMDFGLPPPKAWVTDYADFSNKYGLCYRLSTGHTGVHYNDSTKMIWEPVTNRVEYFARVKETINGVVHAQDSRSSFHMDTFPDSLNKKVTLIKYFKSYLARTKGRRDPGSVDVVTCSPFTAAAAPALTDPHMVSDMIYVKRWLLTQQAMIFRLSDRSIQVCFFDRAEVILCSEAKALTYTDPSGRRSTIPLSAVSSQPEEVAKRLQYTKDILHKLINNREL